MWRSITRSAWTTSFSRLFKAFLNKFPRVPFCLSGFWKTKVRFGRLWILPNSKCCCFFHNNAHMTAISFTQIPKATSGSHHFWPLALLKLNCCTWSQTLKPDCLCLPPCRHEKTKKTVHRSKSLRIQTNEDSCRMQYFTRMPFNQTSILISCYCSHQAGVRSNLLAIIQNLIMEDWGG